jgi:oligopeptide/dipeptide ABC transporter ATP-binding protein
VLDIQDLVTEIRSVRGLVRPVDGVSITVRRGQVVGVVGESGSGKSMTAFSVIRLFPTSAARVISGSVKLAGKELTRLPEARMREVRGRHIGMIFQDPTSYLNPVLTVGRQIAEQFEAHGLKIDLKQRIPELLTMVGLTPEVATRYPHELSGGQCQRVGIALALACEPSVIIADEPTTALDVTIQAQILRLLKRLQQEHGVGLMLITHDLGVVAEICDYVYVMYAARIVEHGPVDAIFDAPQHPYTQGLLAGVLSLHTTKTVAPAITGSVPDLAKPPSGCRFHPRCPQVMATCRHRAPPFFERGGSLSACWLYEESNREAGGERR